MVLYHGTIEEYAKDIINTGVKIVNQNKALDFGPGFYATPSYESAVKWAKRKSIIHGGKASVISIHVDGEMIDQIAIKFEDDLRWARFIVNNRNGFRYIEKVSFKEHNLDMKYDITYGRIADLDVYDVCQQLQRENVLLDNVHSILNPNYAFQYAFHTPQGFNCINKITYRNV